MNKSYMYFLSLNQIGKITGFREQRLKKLMAATPGITDPAHGERRRLYTVADFLTALASKYPRTLQRPDVIQSLINSLREQEPNHV